MKTAISIRDEVFEAAERTAKDLGMSRSELYTKAVGEFVARHAGDQLTERLNAVYGKTLRSPLSTNDLRPSNSSRCPPRTSGESW